MKRRNVFAAVALGSALAVALIGCTSTDGDGRADPPATTGPSASPSPFPVATMQRSVGPGEGSLNLIAWAGYAEDGSKDRTVDWVTPFEDSSGCDLRITIGSTAEEMAELMKTGEYDGISAAGEISLGLIRAGEVAPVNTALIPNYATVAGFLKNRAWNSAGKQMFGVPHGWGANLLMSRRDLVTPAPDSWAAVFDPDSPHKGKVTAYDSPIYIADAALYLKAARPGLGITNPYELDEAQFAAVVDLLKQQRSLIGEYWSDYTKEVKAFEDGEAVIGASWQVIANLIDAGGKAKVDAVVPKEGSTGWSDTWMLSSRAQHPNCMYQWMDWILSPAVNAQAAEWFGQAPAQTRACTETVAEDHCETYHATDAEYAKSISYATTPSRDCGDQRGEVCTDYAAWTEAWADITG